jgi:hypothetical protein
MIRTSRFFSLVVLALASLPALAADFATLSYPIAINVEGEPLRSSVYLKLKVKEYGVPLETFAEGDLDGREAKFAQWMGALRVRDYAKAEAMLRQPQASARSVEPTQIHAVARTPKQIVDMYDNAFGELRDVTVVAQVLAGSRSVFVWEAHGGQAHMRRAFAVDADGGKLAVSEVSMSTPVELLIVNNIMDRMAASPDAYRGVANLKTRYEMALPIDNGTPGANPVVLQFDGEPLDAPIFDTATPPANAVVALYRDAYGALKNHDFEGFFRHFTEKSKAKWQKWYASLAPQSQEQFLAAMTQDRSIHFILDAGPLYLVFHGAPKNWKAGSLKYDYVVKSGSGGLKFANVGTSGFFDDVIGNERLFDQSVLHGTPVVAESRAK